MSDVESKLREMAQLAMLSNRISEIHEKNLKMYPLIFFNDVKSVSIDYDFSSNGSIDNPVNTNRGYVHFRLDLTDSPDNRLEKRFQAIEQSVRQLFWKDVAVEVYFNGELAYGTNNGR